jgi:hypothetical protein
MNPFKAIGRGLKAAGKGLARGVTRGTTATVETVIVRPVVAVKERTQMAILMGVLRHVITTAGGALAANGYVSGEQNTELTGALITIVGVVASILAKRRAA